jgi:hypothetical protein
MAEGQQNGWNEYSKLVLKELETLAAGISLLQNDLTSMREEIAMIKQNEDRVFELKEWKGKIDEVASPTQLSEHIKRLDELETFKTKAVTIFAAIQFMMATALAWSKII